MKKITSLIFFASFGLFCSTTLLAQNIYLNKQDGTTKDYSVKDVQRLTFENDQIVLTLFDGSEYNFLLNDLENYSYSGGTLSTNDFINQANAWELNISPNPSQDIFNIKFNVTEPVSLTYQILDLNGRIIKEETLRNPKQGENKISISLVNLESGIYFFRLINKSSSVGKKIIKL